MHDRNGKPLKVGDKVKVDFVITNIVPGDNEFCNVNLESVHAMPGNGVKTTLSAINTKQVDLIED